MPFSTAHLQCSLALGNRRYQEQNNSFHFATQAFVSGNLAREQNWTQTEHVPQRLVLLKARKEYYYFFSRILLIKKKKETQVRISFTDDFFFSKAFLKTKHSSSISIYFPCCLHLKLWKTADRRVELTSQLVLTTNSYFRENVHQL